MRRKGQKGGKMRHIVIGLLIGLGVVLSGYVQAEDSADLPSFKTGESWTYARVDKNDQSHTGKFVITVTSVSDNGYATATKVLEGAADDEVGEYTQEMNAIKNEDRKFTPFVPYFSFPLTPGKTWEGSWKFTARGGKKNNMLNFDGIMKSRVEGWETITTPAGEFKALKIVFKSKLTDQHSGRGKATTGIRWYSPEVRHIVRSEIKDEGGKKSRDEVTELVSFNPAP